jgi:hypothetical protein
MRKKIEIDQMVRSNQELIEALKNLKEKISADPSKSKSRKSDNKNNHFTQHDSGDEKSRIRHKKGK